jgi:superfamily II RNA helicase
MYFKKYSLDLFQIDACECINNNINPLVSAPTGSGKTAIAEYAIDKIKSDDINNKIVYTCPIKSLCNEKYNDMSKLYPNYIIGLMTGDIIINPNADIVIMTTEVLYNIIVIKKINYNNQNNENSENNKINLETINIENIKCIIYDEVHYINDDDRGHIWEKCLIVSTKKMNSLLVLLSATIGNIDTIIDWLNSLDVNKKFKKVVKLDRPVPLIEYIINSDNKLEIINEDSYKNVIKFWERQKEKGYSIKNELNRLCNKLAFIPDDTIYKDDKTFEEEQKEILGLPSIIFVLSKKKCIEYAEMVNQSYTTREEKDQIINFFDKHLNEFSNCSQYINLKKIILNGIAYHHSGLIPKIREVVEFLIKNKLIKIVFATETFAVGLNFPVKTVVMTGITKPTSSNGKRFLTVSEYKQMAGRAGRRFIDTVGNVIFWFYQNSFLPISADKKYVSWNEFNRIINGQVNNIESKFNIDPNYILKNLNQNLLLEPSDSYINMMIDNSLMYYKFNKSSQKKEIDIPEKYKKLIEIEKNKIEFSNAGITLNDKNYRKLISKLSKDELKDYNLFLNKYFSENSKSDYDNFIDIKNEIIDFLINLNFIKLNIHNNDPNKIIDQLILTTKGLLSYGFNEINSIIFTDNMEYIFNNVDNILPILSMFIDDGKINENKVTYAEKDILYFEKIINTTYKEYMFPSNGRKYNKWNFYPENYIYFKKWITNENMSLDELCNTNWQSKSDLAEIKVNLNGEYSKEYKEIIDEYNNSDYEFLSVIDMGSFVKILIKMNQICEELINNLIKINKADIGEYLLNIKSKIIRQPLKIESLYTK